MTERLAGRVAVITGGTGGIGLATARRFAAEGAHVVLADLDEASGKAAAEEVGGLFVRTDVTDAERVAALFQTAVDTYGSVDVAFNNAGISPPDDDSILDTGIEAWDRVQKVNLTSVYLCCKAVIPHMLRQFEADRARRLDRQHRLVRGDAGLGHVADLVHRLQGRRAGDVPRARRAVRPAGHPRERAVSRGR